MKKIAFAIPFILTAASLAQPKPERDPFVNQASRAQLVQETEIHSTRVQIQPRSHAKVAQLKAPKINVLGLLTNSKEPKAIVSGDKNTYIVAQGDSLGDYRVARIDRSGITLAYKQMHYHCPIGQ